MARNRQLVYLNHPSSTIRHGEHIEVQCTEFDPAQSPPDGEATVRILYVSFDPYMRGRMKPPEKNDYAAAYTIGKPLTNYCVVRVLQSKHDICMQGGTLLVPQCDIGEYAVLSQATLESARKIDNPHDIKLSYFLSALGLTGLTAFSSLYEIGQPKQGETIFISAASGAVGQFVGQISRLEGLKVIGSVGSSEKLDFIRSLGFEGFCYKEEKPQEALLRLAPQGIDVYYDNVGGEHLEAAIDMLNVRGRIVGCGQMSEYNKHQEERYGIRNTAQIVKKRITMRGFIVMDEDMGGKYDAEHQTKMQDWLASGSVQVKERVVDGIENAASAFISMFWGTSFGILVLQVSSST